MPLSEFDSKLSIIKITSQLCSVEIKRNSIVDMIASSMRNDLIDKQQKQCEIDTNSRCLRSRKSTNTTSNRSSNLSLIQATKLSDKSSTSSANSNIQKTSTNNALSSKPTAKETKYHYPSIFPTPVDSKSMALLSASRPCWVKVRKHPINQAMLESNFFNPMKQEFPSVDKPVNCPVVASNVLQAMKQPFSIQRVRNSETRANSVRHSAIQTIFKCEYKDCTYTTTIKSRMINHIYSLDKSVHKRGTCKQKKNIKMDNKDTTIQNTDESKEKKTSNRIIYRCNVSKCSYTTPRKSNYIRHLNAKDLNIHQENHDKSSSRIKQKTEKNSKKEKAETNSKIKQELNHEHTKKLDNIKENQIEEKGDLTKNNQASKSRPIVTVTAAVATCSIVNIEKTSLNKQLKAPQNVIERIQTNVPNIKKDSMIRTRSFSYSNSQRVSDCYDLDSNSSGFHSNPESPEPQSNLSLNQFPLTPDYSTDDIIESKSYSMNQNEIANDNIIYQHQSQGRNHLSLKKDYYMDLYNVIDDVIKSVASIGACRNEVIRNNIVSNLKKIDKLDKSEIITPGWRIIKEYEDF